jgi:tRNA pseudouridine38-40 synthase
VHKIKLIVEYNGANFHGWQIQPGVRTVQAEMQRVIEIIVGKQVPSLEASGRTDSGVHAKGQVVCVCLDKLPNLDVFRRSISALLSREVSVLSAEEVPVTFDPCRDSLSKQYSYQILNRDVSPVLEYGKLWYVPWRVNRERMIEDAKIISGTHDFTSFRGTGCQAKSSVREVLESEVIITDDLITYRVVGKGFLKQMVRNIVGTLVGLASNRIKGRTISQILDAKDRRLAGVTAPAHGLCLDWVKYS